MREAWISGTVGGMLTTPRTESRPTRSPLAPPSLPAVHYAADYAESLVRASVRDGGWARLAPGVYVDAEIASDTSAAGATAVALARLRAVAERMPEGKVVSHASAALLHGLPVWHVPRQTHVTQQVGAHVRRPDDVVRHIVDVGDDERTTVLGLPVTSLLRTVVDCLRTLDPLDGLVVADAALRAGIGDEELRAAVMACVGRRGVRRARELVRVADAGAESPGESVTRYHVLAAGFPAPQTQVGVRTTIGDFWTDLGWPELGVLAEYDGEGKYGAAANEVFFRQKRRDDAIAETGQRLVHVTRPDLRTPELLVARIRSKLPEGLPVHPRPYLKQLRTPRDSARRTR